MVQRNPDDREPMTPVEASNLFRNTVDRTRMEQLRDLILHRALGEGLEHLGDKDRETLHLQWVNLATAYGWGKPRSQDKPTARVKMGKLDSIDACVVALRRIAEAQATATITQDEAADLRATVTAAGQLHRSKAGEDLLARIEEEGAKPIFLEAGASRAEDDERIQAARDADREGRINGN